MANHSEPRAVICVGSLRQPRHSKKYSPRGLQSKSGPGAMECNNAAWGVGWRAVGVCREMKRKALGRQFTNGMHRRNTGGMDLRQASSSSYTQLLFGELQDVLHAQQKTRPSSTPRRTPPIPFRASVHGSAPRINILTGWIY